MDHDEEIERMYHPENFEVPMDENGEFEVDEFDVEDEDDYDDEEDW